MATKFVHTKQSVLLTVSALGAYGVGNPGGGRMESGSCNDFNKGGESNSSIVHEIREGDEGDEVGGGDEWPYEVQMPGVRMRGSEVFDNITLNCYVGA